ncbi:nickel import ATP-binding protein NikE [Paenibacillus campi]|uniref:nickel import ATP-binding protein NikE n=1 Tax=Paenibacillus campi TaxID=3106031 RepID=UPI002AFE23A6|nr:MULTISPECIES: nickel import ATP-binding protein NikE [unclassified Paenibacillus]
MLDVAAVSHSYATGGRLWRKAAFPVLNDVSFTLEPGVCLGLLGSSGTGKTTLGNIILGLQRPTSGQVSFAGIDMYARDRRSIHKVRREVQAVFQDCYAAVNPLMTAARIIGEPLHNYERLSPQEHKRRVAELLEQVGLQASDADKRPAAFSGGQLQRINIARAIALKPKLIVLDEAISSLDMVNQTQILALLSELRADYDMSYLFITHHIQAACTICDQMMVMDAGQIVCTADSAQTLMQEAHPAVRRLVEAQLPEHPAQRLDWSVMS